MTLGIRCGAHAKAGIRQHRDKVLGIPEITGLIAFRQIAAQSKHIADAAVPHIGDCRRNRLLRRAGASQMGHSGDAMIILNHGGDFSGGLLIAAAARGIRNADERGIELCKLLRDRVRRLHAQLALRREDLKRNRLRARLTGLREDVLYSIHNAAFDFFHHQYL